MSMVQGLPLNLTPYVYRKSDCLQIKEVTTDMLVLMQFK